MTSAGPGVPGGVLAEMLVGSLAKTSLEGSTFPPMVTCTFEEKPRPEMVTRVPPVQGPCEGCRPLTANGGPKSMSIRLPPSSPSFEGGGPPASSL